MRAVNGAGSGEWSGPASATTERPELTARFEQAPAEHEGPDSTFSLRVVFSEPVTAGYRNLRDEAIRASNGAVRKASRVNGSSAEREVTVVPSSREAVTVSISGGSDACRQGDAVCTEDGRRLSNSPSVTVEGPPTVPLTAELDGMPEEHDGESTFTFGLTFSEEPRVSYRTLRDSAFDVDGGAVRKASRRQSGSDQSWEITVQPSSHRAVSIRLPETGSCSAGGTICTGDGRPLSHALSASVRGPAAMSVSDGRVEEAAGTAVAFAVTLSRAASNRVTVDYRTRDGSAQAGEDYRAASGTLTFSAGEASKTIEVGVLDDAHDEGEETFTLALSNASGAWLEDAEATGTIGFRGSARGRNSVCPTDDTPEAAGPPMPTTGRRTRVAAGQRALDARVRGRRVPGVRLGADNVVPDRTGRRLPESGRRQPHRITSRGERGRASGTRAAVCGRQRRGAFGRPHGEVRGPVPAARLRATGSIVAAGRSTGVPGLPQDYEWTAWNADEMRASVEHLQHKLGR